MTEWLIGTLIATSGLMIAVLVLREPVRRWFGPRTAYALWLLPAGRIALPPFSYTVERIVPARSPGVVAPAGLTELAAASPPGLLDQLGGWPTLLLVAWLTGAAALLARGVAVYAVQRRAILAQGVQLAMIGSIRLLRSDRIGSPIAFGILDRVIAVPLDFEQRFSERQRCLALEHELAHHRAGDLVANLIAYVLLCLQWFNPLAWISYAAFRFDQEAACDDRVLDRVDRSDRPFYGQAIAKAASGPALLFAGGLGHPSTLSRRLTIMTRTIRPGARRLGTLLIAGGVLALPLTATWAVTYVDVFAPAAPVTGTKAKLAAPVAAIHPAVAPAPVKLAAAAPVPATPAPPAAHAPRIVGPADISFIGTDTVNIHGRTKRWDELTPGERAEIRAATAKARADLNREVARLPEQLAQARKEAERFRNGDFRRQMLEARVNVERSLQQVQAQSAALRAAGQDPEKIKAEIGKSLRNLEAMDIDKIVRDSLVALDVNKIQTGVTNAVKSLDEIERKLDYYDRR